MKKILDLTLKIINDSNNSEMFWRRDRLCDTPFYEHSLDLSKVSEEVFFLNFDLLFKDGNPFVKIRYYESIVSESKKTSTKAKWFHIKREDKVFINVTKTYPVYTLTSGSLSHTTSVKESRMLHKACNELISRCDDIKKKKDMKKLDTRLKGGYKLDTTPITHN